MRRKERKNPGQNFFSLPFNSQIFKMPWFAPRAAASKGGDASSSSSGPTATLDSSPPTISEQEWEEAGRKSGSTGEKIEGSIAPTTLLRLAPPARAAGAEILFSAASAGDVDAVSWSSFVFSSQRDAFEPEKGLENIDFDSSCRSLSLKKTKKLQKKKKQVDAALAARAPLLSTDATTRANPLHAAARSGSISTVRRLLLAAAASAGEEEQKGKTSPPLPPPPSSTALSLLCSRDSSGLDPPEAAAAAGHAQLARWMRERRRELATLAAAAVERRGGGGVGRGQRRGSTESA